MKYEHPYSTKQQKDATIITMQPAVYLTTGILRPIPELPVESQLEPILFVMAVWGESRGEIDEGQKQVALTIMNRWIKQVRYFGVSVRDVLLDTTKDGRREFECFNVDNPNFKKLLKPDLSSWFHTLRIVLPIYIHGFFEKENPTLYYHNKHIDTPKFFQTLHFVKEIGNHRFYTD